MNEKKNIKMSGNLQYEVQLIFTIPDLKQISFGART